MIECEDAFRKQFEKMFKMNLFCNENYLMYRDHNVKDDMLGVNEKMDMTIPMRRIEWNRW